MRATLFIAACALLAVGCTRSNGLYNGGNGGAGGSGGAGGGGGSGGSGGSGGVGGSGGSGGLGGSGGSGGSGGDMSGDNGAPDMIGAVCTSGERRCLLPPAGGGPSSQSCSAGQWKADRKCPEGDANGTGAGCANGYCETPVGNKVTSCAPSGKPDESICDQIGGQGNTARFSCQPFITNPATMPATVSWSCAIAATLQMGGAGTKCTSGAQCRSGFCALDGATGYCFVPCTSATECLTTSIGTTLTCGDVTLHVEGKTLTVQSCIP